MSQSILVCEAQAIGMIGVIRSLGRAGYRVHAVSARADALGFSSRFVSQTATHPAYSSDAFLPWLRHYLREHGIQTIVPSEGFLLAVRKVYAEFAGYFPDANPEAVTYTCFSKAAMQSAFDAAGVPALCAHMPRAFVVSSVAALPEVSGLVWPLYVKTDAVHARDGFSSSVRGVRDVAGLQAAVAEALQGHDRCLVQETSTGVKATVNLWRHKGVIQAASMCVAMHENPHTGGLTAYRRVWWHDAMYADAIQRLEVLDWQGVAMVEYKWDEASGRFAFIELNARYWNALNLDLLSNKDFPRWQLASHFGAAPVEDRSPGRVGYRARYTFPADAGYLISLLRDRREPVARKLKAVAEWVALALHPGVGSDLLLPGDRGLYWRALWRFLSQLGR